MRRSVNNVCLEIAVLALCGCSASASKTSSQGKPNVAKEDQTEAQTKPGSDAAKAGSGKGSEATPTVQKAPEDLSKPADSSDTSAAAPISREPPAGTVYRAFTSLPIETLEQQDLSSYAVTARTELLDAFCIHVYKLPFKYDFSAELAYLCADKKPTATFAAIDRFAKLVGDKPKAAQLALSHNGNITEAAFATAYVLPIPPKWVRTGKIQEYMVKPSEFPNASLYGEVAADMTAETGGDLQFSKYRLYYRTTNKTDDGKTFLNERTTDFEAFQVQGGNPDIGIGAEALATANKDYPYFNTITVTIADQDGGSIVLTVVRLAVNNNGYPEVAARLASDTMLAQATNVHDGMMDTLSEYFIPQK